VKEFLEKIWLLSDEDDELYDKVIVESMYSEVRREVWKLLKTCAIQEGGFCVEMEEILEREIRKYYETV
jgi:predicted metal-dependent hydrolase